jgi:hypothetical protein
VLRGLEQIGASRAPLLKNPLIKVTGWQTTTARGYFAHHHERLIVIAKGIADPVIRPREAGNYADATKFCGSYILGDLRSRGVSWDRCAGVIHRSPRPPKVLLVECWRQDRSFTPTILRIRSSAKAGGVLYDAMRCSPLSTQR